MSQDPSAGRLAQDDVCVSFEHEIASSPSVPNLNGPDPATGRLFNLEQAKECAGHTVEWIDN
jgi:hypothetical protein